jgi:hypothetical protein
MRMAYNCAVSRAANGVRIVYPSRNQVSKDAPQIARVIFVSVKDMTSAPIVQNVAEIAAEDTTGHVLYATFIETDRIELPRENLSDAAMLYWVETSGDQIRTRYSLFHGALGWSTPQNLSSSSWKAEGEFDIGDYMKGAFYYDGQLNFLAQWPQVRDDQGKPLNQIRYRILTVQPSV